MKKFLAISFVLITIASFLVFFNPHQANAVPVSYNLTALTVPFTSYTRAGFDILVESGYNGTVTSVYQGRSSNNTINYEFGYHPTLPLSKDTTANITASASVAATQSISITFANNNNRIAIVGVTFQHNGDTNHNNARMSSVKIGATPFLLALNKTVTCGANACTSEIWYLMNPPTGAQTITITPSSVTLYHMVAGAYSFYNVRNIVPLGVTNSATGTSVTPSVSLTPTFTGTSWILDNIYSLQTVSPSASSNTITWIGKTAAIMGASQFNNAPTISAPNTLSWTTTNVQWITSAIELVPIQNQQNFGFNTAYPVRAASLNMMANGSLIYYVGAQGTQAVVEHIDSLTGIETHDYTFGNVAGDTCVTGNTPSEALLNTEQSIWGYCMIPAAPGGIMKSNPTTNQTVTGSGAVSVITLSNSKIFISGQNRADRFNTNSTDMEPSTSLTTNACELTFMSTNTTTPIDNIACDKSIPNHVTRFWNGMYIYKIGNYYTNSTLGFLTLIDVSTYKKPLSIPASVYGIPNPDVKMLGHWNGADYLLSVSSTSINYVPLSYLTTLLNQNRAFQTYDLTLVGTDNHFFLSPSSINPSQNIKLYGQSGFFLNVTVAKYGMIGLPSGYSMRTTSFQESVVRTLDPRWTNTPSQDYPAITTQTSNFPIVLTVADAPTDAALFLSNPAQVINNVNSAWCITQLDSTHTAECDIPPNQCANVYVSDISVAPTIFLYQGNVCATGTNTKSIAFTNTLSRTFYTMNYGATSSYTPSTNGLSTTVRSTVSPFTYNVIIKNSTGTITQNFTKTISGTIDTHVFNVTNATKPASLYVSISGVGQIYTSYLGSSLTLASAASFFHQYFSYQGFDLLSFIPIIFASMFTRNTVGIGSALTVVCIATLSWLSVVVIPDTAVYTMIFVAVLGMVGYRSIWG